MNKVEEILKVIFEQKLETSQILSLASVLAAESISRSVREGFEYEVFENFCKVSRICLDEALKHKKTTIN